MLEKLEEAAKDEKVKVLTVISQKQALGFYEKLGFSVCGKEFEEENIPMVEVEKNLK